MPIPYFDAHCDTVTTFRPLAKNRGQLDLERLGRFSPSAQVFALWAAPGIDFPAALRRFLRRWDGELGRNEGSLRLCRSAEDAKAAAREGKTAAFLSVEGANLLGCRVAGLTEAYRRGVRLVNLTWNRDNALAGAAMDGGGGLTEDGRRFVRAAWELGVAVDLSHASEAAFWDVLRLAKRPVLCSHSDARALCDHPRNLTDAQIAAIIHNDGCIGLNLCPDFLGRGRDIDAVLAHIDRILCLDGRENLCLGCDFDGTDELPEGIEGVQDLEKLYEAMLKMNLSERLVRDIFYNNLLRFLENAL